MLQYVQSVCFAAGRRQFYAIVFALHHTAPAFQCWENFWLRPGLSMVLCVFISFFFFFFCPSSSYPSLCRLPESPLTVLSAKEDLKKKFEVLSLNDLRHWSLQHVQGTLTQHVDAYFKLKALCLDISGGTERKPPCSSPSNHFEVSGSL